MRLRHSLCILRQFRFLLAKSLSMFKGTTINISKHSLRSGARL
jgi:hypothetical protein